MTLRLILSFRSAGVQSDRKRKATSNSNMNCLLLFVAGTKSDRFFKVEQQKATPATKSNFRATKSNFRRQKIKSRATTFVASDKSNIRPATEATSNSNTNCLLLSVAGTKSNGFLKLEQQKATLATKSNFRATKSNFGRRKI